MITIKGKYNKAICFCNELEQSSEDQIRTVCDLSIFADSKIRIMPDVHTGKGCTIGTTMTIGKYIVPNMVGVDIGCGMQTIKLKEKEIKLPEIDSFIRSNIPSGREVRQRAHRSHGRINIGELYCIGKLKNTRRIENSLGSLGGGNHFIEIDRDDDGNLYLVIHSGSRNVGLQVANHYQNIAYNAAGGKAQKDIPYELASLSGTNMENYLHDMAIMQSFADLNRHIIKEVILDGLNLKDDGSFTTVHNYIDIDSMILRKGAVSAKQGETLLIPINMRDGSLICTGLGNEEWNYSAPHGAGRVMSRTQAKKSFTVSAFKDEMKGIFTTSISDDTLDEAPMAYKPIDAIVSQIGSTAEIINRIKPIYNFKAAE